MAEDDTRQVIALLEQDIRRLEDENAQLRALLLRAQDSLSSAYTVLLDIAEALA